MPYLGPLLAAATGRADAGSTGGAETQILLLARALNQRGRRVAIATFDLGSGLPEHVEGIEIVRLPMRPLGGARVERLRWRFALLVALARKSDAEVLVQRAAGAETGWIGVLARLRHRRFAYSSANVIDFEFDRLERSRRVVRLFRLGVRLAHVIVVQTHEQADLCRRHWHRPSVVIRSLAEPARLRSAEPDAFLWIGRMAPYKRPEAFVDLAARVPQARFLMVGAASPLDMNLFDRVSAAAAGLSNLELLPFRARADLAPLFDRAVAVVNTSDFEGMPNVFLEGWARGIPALALSHDPDGVIERHRLGWHAHSSAERLAELADASWEARYDQGAIARRCRDHLAREHAADAVAARWEQALGLSAQRGEARPTPAA